MGKTYWKCFARKKLTKHNLILHKRGNFNQIASLKICSHITARLAERCVLKIIQHIRTHHATHREIIPSMVSQRLRRNTKQQHHQHNNDSISLCFAFSCFFFSSSSCSFFHPCIAFERERIPPLYPWLKMFGNQLPALVAHRQQQQKMQKYL